MHTTFPVLDPVAYHHEVLPGLIAERGADAAADLIGVAPLTLSVEGDEYHYSVSNGTIALDRHSGDDGASSGAFVELRREAWSDLVQQLRTVPSLQLAGELQYRSGGFAELARWEPALRLLYAGIPIYNPATAQLVDRDGAPLDLTRSFAFDNADEGEMAWFVERAGYLHVTGVFSAEEIEAINDEVDRLAAMARPNDNESWWAKDAEGNDVLCRLVYAGMRSERIAALDDDPRLQRLIGLTGLPLRAKADRNEGHSVLLKSPGELRGLANIPWHTDCGLGGHPFLCPSIAVGVQLTAASADAGRFEVVPGSHGQTCRYGVTTSLGDAPVVGIDTNPGDVTLHVADVTHASPPPRGAGGRRVLYVTFANPALFDIIQPGEAINDVVRNRQAEADQLTRSRRG